MYIYIDVFFAYNFLMDFFVLYITRKILKLKYTYLRIMFASLIGAFYAIISIPFLTCYIKVFTYLIIPLIMSLISFGRKEIIKVYFTLFVVAASVSGIINLLYYSTSSGPIIKRLINFNVLNISVIVIVCAIVIALILFNTIYNEIFTCRTIAKKYLVEVGIDNEKVLIEAIIDTGNSLIDPYFKKPVSIVNQNELNKLAISNPKFYLVPYHSVGMSNGIIKAIKVDYMKVDMYKIIEPLLGIYEGELSSKNDYQMLLHKDILKER